MLPKAKDLMERHLVYVGPDTPIADVYSLFVEEQIHGAPVVADDGSLVGVITTTDLLRAMDEERDTVRVQTDYFRDVLAFSAPSGFSDLEDFQDRLGEVRTAEVMTSDVLSVPPGTPASTVAHVLRENQVHRVFVTEGGVLLGVISAFDLLRLVEDWKD